MSTFVGMNHCPHNFMGSFLLQIIGALLMGVGCIGLYGSMKSNREALNIHLLGVLLAMMMAFNFIGQVELDPAELLTLSKHTNPFQAFVPV